MAPCRVFPHTPHMLPPNANVNVCREFEVHHPNQFNRDRSKRAHGRPCIVKKFVGRVDIAGPSCQAKISSPCTSTSASSTNCTRIEIHVIICISQRFLFQGLHIRFRNLVIVLIKQFPSFLYCRLLVERLINLAQIFRIFSTSELDVVWLDFLSS